MSETESGVEDLEKGGAARDLDSGGAAAPHAMHSLTGQVRKEAHNRVAYVCVLRGDGNYSEEEIAKKAGFGSAEAMHTQLGNWGLSGLLPKRAEGSGKQPKQKKPKAGSHDPGTELPRPVAATALFEEAINALREIVEDLEHYRLVRKDGHFINTHVYHDPVYFPRSSFTPAQWTELCEVQGQDPNSRGFMDTDAAIKDPTGGGKYPPRPLVNLIAVYALLEQDMRSLLQALHPDPSSVDGTRISGLLYKNKHDHGRDGLVRTAEQLAELVCGGDGRRGSPGGYLSAREQNVACSITDYREQGWSDEKICEYYASLGLSRKRVLELGHLGLRWPED